MARIVLMRGMRSYQHVKKYNPWARGIVKTAEGCICFESVTDFRNYVKEKTGLSKLPASLVKCAAESKSERAKGLKDLNRDLYNLI